MSVYRQQTLFATADSSGETPGLRAALQRLVVPLRYGGNRVEAGRFVSDGVVIIDTTALARCPQSLQKTAKTYLVTQRQAEDIWNGALGATPTAVHSVTCAARVTELVFHAERQGAYELDAGIGRVIRLVKPWRVALSRVWSERERLALFYTAAGAPVALAVVKERF